MSSFFQGLLTSGLARALALKLLRQGCTWAGGLLVTWLVAHHSDPTDAQNFAGYLAGAVLTGTSIIFDMLDAKTVDAKITTAAAAGVAQGQALTVPASAGLSAAEQKAVDQATVNAVHAAIATADDKASRTALTDLLAQMRAGKA